MKAAEFMLEERLNLRVTCVTNTESDEKKKIERTKKPGDSPTAVADDSCRIGRQLGGRRARPC